MSKACKDCGETKELGEFPRNKGREDGRAGRCKACMARKVREGRAEGKFKAKPRSGFKSRDRKAVARDRARNAVRSGDMAVPWRCEDCGTPKRPEELQMHHEDHNRALDVQFLCSNCHGKKTK